MKGKPMARINLHINEMVEICMDCGDVMDAETTCSCGKGYFVTEKEMTTPDGEVIEVQISPTKRKGIGRMKAHKVLTFRNRLKRRVVKERTIQIEQRADREYWSNQKSEGENE